MAVSRRTMLSVTPALASLGWASGAAPAAAETSSGSGFDPWVEVNADNLRHNVRQVASRVSPRPILAVIKNNGYGGGVVEVARLLEAQKEVAGLAVIKLQEAMALRDAGVRKPILLMGPFDDEGLEAAVFAGITPMVYTPLGVSLDRIAAKRQSPTPVHVCVDTGIGRVGVPHTDAMPLLKDLAARPSVRIEGTMMTFTEDPEFDREQLRRFRELCGSLAAEGVPLGRQHAASSFALFQNADSFLDMVRPGMALYGIYPEHEFRGAGTLDLRPALSLKARVIYVKQLRKGSSAGYNRAYVAGRDVWVATLPVGHADGLPRAAANTARVRIGDSLYPLIASVSASHSIVEIGAERRVEVGDTATIFDWREGSRPEDLSAACGASVYDLAMHLGALLPRRIV
jgi:alanine racemase